MTPAQIKDLSNRAEGIYQFIGGQNMLYRMICNGNDLASAVNHGVSLFTRFTVDHRLPSMEMRETVSAILVKVGDLLCDLDILIAAAGEHIAPEPSKRVDASYMMEYRMLLREALMGGMPGDYAGTAQNPYRISLTKPAVAFGGRFDPDEFDDGTYMAFTAREEPRDRCLILRCTGPELDAIQRYCDVLHVNYKEKELKNG